MHSIKPGKSSPRLFVSLTLYLLGLLLMLAPAGSLADEPARLVALQNHVPSNAIAAAQPIGPVDGRTPLSLGIVLPLRNQSNLKELLKRLYNPADALYGHYLTTKQYTDRFGPTEADYQSVIDFARASGFRIEQVHPNRTMVNVSAPASLVESVFDVTMTNFQKANGRYAYASTAEPKIPAFLKGKVAAIIGLDNFAEIHPGSYATPVKATVKQNLAEPLVSALSIGSGPGGYLTPYNIKKAYNLNKSTLVATNQILAVASFDGYDPADINYYQTNYVTSPAPVQYVLVDGGPAGTGNLESVGNGSFETTMDIELQSAIASEASEILVYLGNANVDADGKDFPTEADYYDVYNQIANENRAKTISTSWGEDEADDSIAFLDALNVVFQQMAAQGQSMFAASGDSGAYADNGNTAFRSVDNPASQPFVTGVGGTHLSVTGPGGTWTGETTWAGMNSDGSAYGSGGGASFHWPIPNWQSGVISSQSLGDATKRNVPDVSLDSDPNTGYAIYYKGSFHGLGYGGTSAAAPLWAGFAALVNKQRSDRNVSLLGFANPALYRIGKSAKYHSDFHDIADGSTNEYYPAVAGYDDATGWGSFNGANLLSDLSTATLPAPSGVVVRASLTSYGWVFSLSWNSVAGASKYQVYRSATPGGEGSAIYVTTGYTSYPDAYFPAGQTYYYKVTALDGNGESPRSTEVSATAQAPLPAPVLTGTIRSAGEPQLKWTPVSGAISYNVYRNSSVYITLSGNTFSFTDHAVLFGQLYRYLVCAVGVSGEGTVSNECDLTPGIPDLPAPSGVVVRASLTSYGWVFSLSWNSVAGASKYQVYRSATPGGEGSAIYVTTGYTSYPDAYFPAGQTYYYKVTALDGNGESPRSTEVSATAQAPLPAPVLMGSIDASGTPHLQWNAVSGAKNYNLYRDGFIYKTGLTSLTYGDSATIRSQLYRYLVCAVGVSGEGAASNECDLTPGIPDLPAPSGVVVRASLTSYGWVFSLSWNSVAGASKYQVYRSATPGGEGSAIYVTTGYTSYPDAYFPAGQTYYYKVTALDGNGESPRSTEVSATAQAPLPAPVLTGTIIGGVNTLNWTLVKGAKTYNLYRDSGIFRTGLTATNYSDKATTRGQLYRYLVCAVGVSGEGAASNECDLTPGIPDLPAPSGVVVRASLTSYGWVFSLSWNSVAGASKYQVYRSATPGGEGSAIYVTTGYTSYPDAYFPAGQTYYYKVTALDGNGESPRSTEVSATAQAPLSAPVLTGTIVNGINTLNWTSVSGVKSYNLYRDGSIYKTGLGSTSYSDSVATRGQLYRYLVCAVGVSGEGTVSNECDLTPGIPDLPAPSGVVVRASLTSYGWVFSLSWNNVAGANKYQIYRSATPGGEGSAIYVTTGYTSYPDAYFPAGQTYYYKVTALDGNGESPRSVEVGATAR